MFASKSILTTWRKFDNFSMDTLTKAWYYQRIGQAFQRNVSLMKEHREQFGVAGNCFDLAIWLLEEFKSDGMKAYPIGHELGTEAAHVAVIAVDEEGHRFLCDLGDQWLEPILIDKSAPDYSNEKLAGFFPAAHVQVIPKPEHVEILYFRPNGKVSNQRYITNPVPLSDFIIAANSSQKTFKQEPLVEIRTPHQDDMAHWEFGHWRSFLSTNQGVIEDHPLSTIEEWTERIHAKTGYNGQVIREALMFYRQMQKS
ncbi:hypothetical protein LC087_11590 [Bacillus carboniphilus]|uniref:Uncharacterized protein n=1 Tax=Bacillus carboniphilus TaxID=86663 RepID=A0ABY9JQ73_9BACI|nr:hypothetical protein [Bacillus carboniphilus]WLR41531.1 hypothetical protein LC087_11590 [Bacillus carboniphilus]